MEQSLLAIESNAVLEHWHAYLLPLKNIKINKLPCMNRT
uniref:Uncharacterized protein n=1 Tax=Anguilla anguilla TaxID=7936 RepID=A0A0E9RZ93_ANGAN